MNCGLASSIAVPCILAFSLGVRAEPATAQSIEWVIAQSDRIVVGKVVEVGLADGTKCETITVAVTKTPKGEHAERVQFVISEGYSGCGKQWLDEGIPMVFCLVKTDVRRIPVSDKKFPWAIRGDGRDACAILLGKSKHRWPGGMPAYTRDCEILEKSDEILKHVEKTVQTQGNRRLSSHEIDVPGGTAVWEKLFARNAVFLNVPVDAELEDMARTWCKSKNPEKRFEGVKALRHFKSDDNVELLKTLLDDPSYYVTRSAEYVGDKTIYTIRKEAYETLRDFGIVVPRPVLEKGPSAKSPMK